MGERLCAVFLWIWRKPSGLRPPWEPDWRRLHISGLELNMGASAKVTTMGVGSTQPKNVIHKIVRPFKCGMHLYASGRDLRVIDTQGDFLHDARPSTKESGLRMAFSFEGVDSG